MGAIRQMSRFEGNGASGRRDRALYPSGDGRDLERAASGSTPGWRSRKPCARRGTAAAAFLIAPCPRFAPPPAISSGCARSNGKSITTSSPSCAQRVRPSALTPGSSTLDSPARTSSTRRWRCKRPPPADLLLAGLNDLITVVGRQAVAHRDTLMIGRTHGMHAEPTTFGHKLAVWYDELRRQQRRLDARARGHRGGKNLRRGRNARACSA